MIDFKIRQPLLLIGSGNATSVFVYVIVCVHVHVIVCVSVYFSKNVCKYACVCMH